MAVQILSGVPGSGKTLYSVYLARKHYEKENKKLVKLYRKIKLYVINFKIFLINIPRSIFRKSRLEYREDIYKKYIYDSKKRINNVYSNFPILLDKRRGIYSNKISLWELDNRYSFLPYSLIIIDEVQMYIDSEEYKDFPKEIAKFNQAHRHFGIKDIIYISQHPSRVVKKLRNLTNEFYKINFFSQIPIFIKVLLLLLLFIIHNSLIQLILFLLFMFIRNKGIFSATIYYEFEEYGKSTKIDKKYATYDFKNKFMICNIKKLYKCYDTCYLKAYNLDKDLCYGKKYSSKYIDKEDLEVIFPLDKSI